MQEERGKTRERSTAWGQCLAALPSWSWGRPQGRAGGWREGGRICGGESCGLSWGLLMGHGVQLLQPRVSPRELAGEALLSWEGGVAPALKQLWGVVDGVRMILESY